ncbi:hypothetical protein BDL97_18G055300 [Sphagnum fallax]|nr:hypothetical protein BDL97_18G055300 [Sphagnum fallax]KAH8933902.1 hypothetical protein BDL97_18G055300 [Sphagnum fallax]KAH8933903.1 hypothetical protein BDL97_18G055300 [Sphagnum fallax]
MMAKTQEPDTAPRADKWYRLKLGPTISEQNSSRFYTLRYEFKPASIDTGTPGTLHKGVENKVTVEFSNNQAGKPKVAFQGNSEDCKDLDAIIFFDGTSFRLERLHRAVKSLRHVRLPGESASAVAAAAAASASGLEPSRSSPVHLNGSAGAVQALAPSERNPFKAHVVREQITDDIPVGKSEAPATGKKNNKRKTGNSKSSAKKASPIATFPSDAKQEQEQSPNVEIDDIDLFEPEPEPEREQEADLESEPEPEAKKMKKSMADPVEEVDVVGDEEIVEVLEEHSDYEIEDVDVSEDDEADGDGKDGTMDSAAALRAQAAGALQSAGKNGSSSESGSGSSGSSESGSSSSESGSDNDEDSASSGDDI